MKNDPRHSEVKRSAECIEPTLFPTPPSYKHIHEIDGPQSRKNPAENLSWTKMRVKLALPVYVEM